MSSQLFLSEISHTSWTAILIINILNIIFYIIIIIIKKGRQCKAERDSDVCAPYQSEDTRSQASYRNEEEKAQTGEDKNGARSLTQFKIKAA